MQKYNDKKPLFLFVNLTRLSHDWLLTSHVISA